MAYRTLYSPRCDSIEEDPSPRETTGPERTQPSVLSQRASAATVFPAPSGHSASYARVETNGAAQDEVYRFRRFVVFTGARALIREGRRVDLGARAFDLLVVLLRSRGALVTKREIMSHVWPSLAVDESNIRFQVAELRGALGEDRDLIKSLSGRGYVFALDAPLDAILPSQTNRLEGTSQNTLPAWEDDAGSDRGGSSVVVIDDDAHTREALQGLLRSVGLHVELFGSVHAFASTNRESAPGCIILDVCLPGRSGLDFHAEFAKAHPRIPVIFISGHADVPMSVRAMKAGAMEFLTKPVRHHDLLEAIQSAMNR